MFYSEKYIKHSRKDRRCVGCDRRITIRVGDPYWSCFSVESYAVGYAMCVACREHVSICDECTEAWREGDPSGIEECRLGSNNEYIR